MDMSNEYVIRGLDALSATMFMGIANLVKQMHGLVRWKDAYAL